jgi:hypothetical protein
MTLYFYQIHFNIILAFAIKTNMYVIWEALYITGAKIDNTLNN